MQYQAFSKDTDIYPLTDDYRLVRANPDTTDFVHHWAAYRPNETFHQNWTQRYSDLIGVPVCFWIEHEEQPIGGCLTFPNMIAELFLIPPFDDYDAVLDRVLPLLRHWSDDEKNLYARYVLPEQVEAFSNQGFTIIEQRQFMIRPAMSYQVNFDEPFAFSKPETSEIDAYADVFLAAFSGSIGEYGQRDKAAHVNSITKILEGALIPDASLVVKDEKTDTIACICLVTEYAGHTSINFVVTHSDYQRRGLGKLAIQCALNSVYGTYPWMILAVTIGNPAENLYRKMGFRAGVVISTMST